MLKLVLYISLFSYILFSQNKIDPNVLPFISKKDSLNSLDELRKDIKNVLSKDYIVQSNYGLCIYSLDRKEYIFSVNENTPLTPASVTKLFTTFNALYNFGENATINTELWYEDDDNKDKVIDRNLYIVGNGDALLSQKDIDTLFGAVKAMGINVINGDILIDLSHFDDETNRFEYSGDNDRVAFVGTISPLTISRTTGEKAINIIQSSLKINNIEFNGNIEECAIPTYSDAKKLNILVRYQRPLIDIINITNKNSDNYLAEHLFKLNASKNKVFKRDYDNSRDLLFSTLDKLKIECKNCDINDGSGLSRRNKVTAKSVVQLLSKAKELEIGDEFYKSLSIAGKDGTLRKRLKETSGEYYVNAKTGTLRNASSLAGYVMSIDGELFAFAFIFNGNHVSSYKRTEDELAELLAGFFYYNVIN
jgi:D-alanyl-D-alanine carboxypeptidase/D-alanyl-D-alanine-endopeptidase (penicillin-binding protein 4)